MGDYFYDGGGEEVSLFGLHGRVYDVSRCSVN